MNKVVVVADSTIDLSPELIEKNDIKIIPLHVSFPGDEKVYSDGIDLKPLEVYEKVEEIGKTPKTSARNVGEFIDDLKPYIDAGNDIILTGVGQELSSTYQNAMLAAQEFPEGRIEIVDSRSLSTGTGLLVLKMCELRDQGLDIHQIAEEVRKLVPLVSAKFCIDKLEYLYKGGRCSGMSKTLATVLKLHPVAKMIDGKLIVYRKPMGKYMNAINVQLKEFIRDFEADNIDTSHVFVTDSYMMEGEDEYLINEIKKYIPEENIHHTHAGCVVSAHCGPKTIGILYILKRKIDY